MLLLKKNQSIKVFLIIQYHLYKHSFNLFKQIMSNKYIPYHQLKCNLKVY